MAAETVPFPGQTGADAAVSQLSNWSLVGAQAAADPISSAADWRVTFAGRETAYAWTKRALDISAAVTLLLVLLPLFAVIGLAIVLESRGPVFYRGDRVG